MPNSNSLLDKFALIYKHGPKFGGQSNNILAIYACMSHLANA